MRTLLRSLILTAAGAGLLLAAAPASAAYHIPPQVRARLLRLRELRLRVAAYAKDHLGQQVGTGQCWDLVDDALRDAGADTSGDGNYVFGAPVDLGTVIPGDLLQFENVHFEHHSPDGSWYTSDYPHHSAIVASVSGRTITLLNQNVNGNQTVQYSTINLNDQTSGTITAFMPKLK